MTILYYDLNEVLIERYPMRIASSIGSERNDIKHLFIFSEKYRDGIVNSSITINSEIHYLPWLRKKELLDIIKKNKVVCGVVCGQRIPDMRILNLLRSLNINSYLIQHGLWADRLQRIGIFRLLSQKYFKFAQYLWFSWELSRSNKIPYISFLKDLYSFLLIEKSGFNELQTLSSNILGADFVISFDDSWRSYYVNKYGYKESQLSYVGNPDISMLKKINAKYVNETYVAYIAQTLVEDGRMSKKTFQNFFEKLNAVCRENGFKLVVRRHPRTDDSIYKEVSPDVLLTNDMVACHRYVGHYSGLLSTVSLISKNIFLWKFHDHHFPDYFDQFGQTSGYKEEELVQWLLAKPKHKIFLSFENIKDPIELIKTKVLSNEFAEK